MSSLVASGTVKNEQNQRQKNHDLFSLLFSLPISFLNLRAIILASAFPVRAIRIPSISSFFPTRISLLSSEKSWFEEMSRQALTLDSDSEDEAANLITHDSVESFHPAA